MPLSMRIRGTLHFGRTRGVFSSIVNQVTSGSIIVTAVAAIASVTGSENVGCDDPDRAGRPAHVLVLVPDPEYIFRGHAESVYGGDPL